MSQSHMSHNHIFHVQYGVNVLRKRVNLHNPEMLNVTKSHVTK